MRITADLHIHSRFSMAASARLTLPWLDRWARIKGIDLLGTGDCCHPRWLEELGEQLEEAGDGLYTLKEEARRAFDARSGEEAPLPGRRNSGGPAFPLFVLSAEISTVYKRGDRTRKVHHLVLLPGFKAAGAFQKALGRLGNISSDGRPVLGIDSRELLALLLDTAGGAILIPAHIWTPWFSLLGSKSGFDSLEECYGSDLSAEVPAIETGLSSNPPMNWALGSLDRFSIISNSDAHSPDKLGREATVFDMDLSYPSLCSALRKGAVFPGIIETIELFPQEGKYYHDGHRKCGISLGPGEAGGGICPVCGKALTRGVLGRVLELADRPLGESLPRFPAGTNRRPYRSLIPLKELLAELLQSGAASKKVGAAYAALIETAGPELFLLAEMPLEEIRKLRCPGLAMSGLAMSGPFNPRLPRSGFSGPGSFGELLEEAVRRMRSGELFISPGYDGKYGRIRAFSPDSGEPL
jgi:PHP family Zn ribbon phosphoesterase